MRQIKRIALIEPEAPGFHVFSHFKMPRLGLPLLGAILSHRGYDVSIYATHLSKEDLRHCFDCDLIGISSTTSTAPEAYRLADLFRSRGKTVVIGGVHASFLSEEALEHADFVVRGEGEDSFPELIRRIEADELPHDVPGVSYRDGESVVHNPKPQLIEDLDRLPFPDFSLLKPKPRLFNVPVQTSRGCPFPCNFCNVTQMFGRKVRFRSVQHVLDEMAQLPKQEIFFYDDNFCSNPKYTKELCEGILRRGLKPRYSSAQVRADVTRDLELMDLLSRSGVDLVYVGFESVNPDTLKEYDKHQTVEEITKAMEIFRRFKIRVHGMFVIGSDHDSIHAARETLEFVRQQRIETIQFMMLTPIPGTGLYQQLCAENRIITKDWKLYDAHHAVYLPKRMSSEELQNTTFEAMSRFYSLREGLRGLAKRDLYQASRRFMGWYIIKRWKWANRGWLTALRAQTVKAQRAALNRRLEDIQRQLEELLRAARGQLSPLGFKVEELRKKMEGYYKEISRISREVFSAFEDDLTAIERRTEEISAAVRKTLEEFKAISKSVQKNTLRS